MQLTTQKNHFHTLHTFLYKKLHSDTLHTCHRRTSTRSSGTWRGALQHDTFWQHTYIDSTQWCHILTPCPHATATHPRASMAHDAALYQNNTVSHPMYMHLHYEVTFWHPTYMPQPHAYPRVSAAQDAAFYKNHEVSHPIYMTLPNAVTLSHPTWMPQPHI